MECLVKADAILTENGFERDRFLHIKDGTVSDIKDSSCSMDCPAIIDFTGCILIPGFCDYHLHFFKKNSLSDDAIIETLRSHGITEVFEGGDSRLHGFITRDAAAGRIEIKSAGCAIHRKGSYGEFIGRGVDSIQEARDLIDWLHHEGADYIKIINSGIFQPDTGAITPGGFEINDLTEIVQYAKDKGFYTACHANGEKAVRDAVESGVSSVIHGLYVSEETLSAMAEKRVHFVPTLNAFASLSALVSDDISAGNIAKAVDGHMNAVRSAQEKGVRVLPGSDSGPSFIPYGRAYHNELKLFQKAGFPLEDILLSASSSVFEKGMKADFLVLKGLKVERICTAAQ